jgi:hypothetical protein
MKDLINKLIKKYQSIPFNFNVFGFFFLISGRAFFP